jgi:hypothetical protein
VANQSTTVAKTGVEQFYEQMSGPVFAYCYAPVGSRSMAEWAVTATFDRARAASANGGIPEPELDRLLRTADKFCAPRLRVDGGALAGESVLVMQDWRGRSFDEIEAELTARQARLDEERNRLTPWRRLLGALNLGPAAGWVKGLFAGASAVQVTAAAVAVVGAIAVVATPIATKLHGAVNPPSKEPAPSVKPPAVVVPKPAATGSLPQMPTVSTPTVSTPTVPSTSDVTPTVPSVDTPTVPSVSTPSAPSTPTTPSTPSVPSVTSTGSPPKPPTVSTPTVPPPPPAPTVTTPTVTLPGK